MADGKRHETGGDHVRANEPAEPAPVRPDHGPRGGALGAAELLRAEEAQVKVGLYGITYLGVWYRGAALTLEQVIDRAKQYGYEGVEVEGKRPHGNPLDWPKARCQDLLRYARDRGVEIYAVAANNDFSSPIPEHRECQIVYLRDLVRMTADLGAKE